VLGVIPEARGIGLGRALLRWGVNWLEHQNAPRVHAVRDGENETALRLSPLRGIRDRGRGGVDPADGAA